MLPFLRDQADEVRRAAGLAVLWDAQHRWFEIRSEIRLALSEPHAAKDGPLPCSAGLPQAAIDDLVMWSSESGPVGLRSTQTLVRLCKKAILEDGSAEAIARVTSLVVNVKVPAAIRVELAHRLKDADQFEPTVAAKLLGPANPTMLRLLAAGALLALHEDRRALDVVKEVAQQPNREISLAAAKIIQKHLGVDMGLPMGGELPATNTRQAAEVARRVLFWATKEGSQAELDTPPDGVPLAKSSEPESDW
mgnify:CR=1 FL=1